jgi:GntR family transcriptional regulator / MocR family aminotransferase
MQSSIPRVPTTVLPEVVFEAASRQPLNAQLVQALKQAIASGRLRVGTKLPPSREAAVQLGVGRNTVVDAYSQLMAEGLIETQGRHGSMVAASPAKRVMHSASSHQVSPAFAIARLKPVAIRAGKVQANWRLGQACAQLLPLRVWRAASKEAGRHLPPSGYGDPRGEQQLRQAIADWLRKERGVHYEADQIIVTQGAGAAVDLLAQLLVQPGDMCVVESPGYPRAANTLRTVGAKLREVPVDSHGLNVQKAFMAKAPVLLHITPSHQYPLGGRLTGARRRELAHFVQQHNTLILENEYDHEFIYEGQNHAPLAASLPAHTVLVSTFAKAVSPALRLGFLAAPAEVAFALAEKIESERLHVSWPVQLAMAWLLRSGELQKHLRRVRRYYAELRAHLLRELALQCPQLHVSGQEGGLHLVLRCEKQAQTDRFINLLRESDVAFNTLVEFGGKENAVLLAYGQLDQKSIKKTILLIKTALK